jgi:LIM domain
VDYLSSLRSDRPARPSGSRPPPFKTSTYPSPAKEDLLPRANSTVPEGPSKSGPDGHLETSKSGHASEVHVSRNGAKSPVPPTSPPRPRTGLGRPLVFDPAHNNSYSVRGRKVSPTAVVQATPHDESVPYRESGARWMERQEAISLRDALKVMDQKEQEKRIHKAARDEAAELVWKHRNPLAAEAEKSRPFRNPDLTPNNRLRAHLLKGAHARSQSVATESAPSSMAPNESASRRWSSGQRIVSSGSSKGVFRNPDDQIYEEPEEAPASQQIAQPQLAEGGMPLQNRHRNSLPRGSRPLPDRSSTIPESKKLDLFEIHRNPPSQSRNAAYTANSPLTTPMIEFIPEVDAPTSKDGIEIRSDDIRAATTMRLKDRSPKLPTPTAVSDVPGRPIVSFEKTWQPTEDSSRPEDAVERNPVQPYPIIPAVTVSAPTVPIINLPDDDDHVVPVANKDTPPIPSISIADAGSTPLISVTVPSAPPTIEVSSDSSDSNNSIENKARPLPRPSKTFPPNLSPTKPTSRLPWLNSSSRAGVPTATCANCSLPISGRIVTASGSSTNGPSQLKAMFHPECFNCHQCSTALECVAFYPEPTSKRHERLAAEGIPTDSDIDIRFFCHLDFHEFFSPRCKSCKTPIEGEVIVAAGAEWHVGHFFCGECGDPFDSNKPFVERDGYAYCVSCHTKRTSARCRACKKQILEEMTVEALGGKWHEGCFVCFECQGGFGAEGRFFVRDVEVECTEKEKRRGMKVKVEERAVCQGCEEKRLKA